MSAKLFQIASQNQTKDQVVVVVVVVAVVVVVVVVVVHTRRPATQKHGQARRPARERLNNTGWPQTELEPEKPNRNLRNRTGCGLPRNRRNRKPEKPKPRF